MLGSIPEKITGYCTYTLTYCFYFFLKGYTARRGMNPSRAVSGVPRVHEGWSCTENLKL